MQSMLTYSTPIKIGDSGSYAWAVRVFLTQHHLLTEKEADTDDYSTGKYKRDYYGKNTKKTILRFQKSEWIEQTGIVWRKTKEKIIEISCHK